MTPNRVTIVETSCTRKTEKPCSIYGTGGGPVAVWCTLPLVLGNFEFHEKLGWIARWCFCDIDVAPNGQRLKIIKVLPLKVLVWYQNLQISFSISCLLKVLATFNKPQLSCCLEQIIQFYINREVVTTLRSISGTGSLRVATGICIIVCM
ncbi:uncharacterized protein LOC110903924 isoform X2 [Helianthus annuus]|uniref:uncharacterized protein LOC110903924 isoform X2 n=1 Tax=Helianthus annuus TaxID=4232 RepID=UPI000B901ECC|nr:uncharacterized protein LOC110903924 isoform X2 [Helianthus annuus]